MRHKRVDQRQRKKEINVRTLIATLILAMLGMSAARAEPFYQGKTVTLMVGNAVGGGYDTYARIVARHIGRYIPGNPTVIVQNKPGAAGKIAIQWVINQAPQDGTVLLAVYPDLCFKQGSECESLTFLGSIEKGNAACVLGPRSKHLGTFREILEKGIELKVGTAEVGSFTYNQARMFKYLTGANMTLVSGYEGSNGALLALERGEVDVVCSFSTSLLSQRPGWFAKGEATVLLQTGDEFGSHVPQLSDVKDKLVAEREKLKYQMARPYGVSRNVPQEQATVLERAFEQMVTDAAFLKDVGQAQLTVDWLDGKKVKQILDNIATFPPDVIKRAEKAIEPSS